MLGKVPRENGLADSLLVRLRNLYSSLLGAAFQAHQSELLINYRCHPAIVRLPSRLFYDCRIQVCTYMCACVPVYVVHVHGLFMHTCCVCMYYCSICAVHLVYVCDLSVIRPLQTRTTSVPHPGWEKMVYFVCSSFALRAPTADSKWSTQKELLAEAELEVQELKLLVQEFICKQSRKRKPTSSKKTTSGVDLSEGDLSSVCVMFPTRLTVSALCIGLGMVAMLCAMMHACSHHSLFSVTSLSSFLSLSI